MRIWNRTFPDPIRGLTLERLSQQLDGYNYGRLAEFAVTAEAMEQRDDILKNVILKRKKALARHGWAILTEDDSPEATRHKQALEYFYRHLRCTHVLKQDAEGGFNMLVHQMMDAVAKGWAVHEITWKARAFKIEDFRLKIGKEKKEGAGRIEDLRLKIERAKREAPLRVTAQVDLAGKNGWPSRARRRYSRIS